MTNRARGEPTLSLPAEAVALGGASLVVAPGTVSERQYRLGSYPISIGSDADNTIVLDDRHVSGHHARVRLGAGGYELEDLGSTNGTRVHGVVVSSALLRPGAVITLGTTSLRFDGPEPGSGDDGPTRFGAAIGRTPAMRQIFALLERLSSSDLTITLLGETGTGKDVLATAIHASSRRARGPFVVFDCGAAAPSLIESQLFGHERGAFTGAVDEVAGAFERADGGTLFIDEIGELSLDLQPKLLRVLESRKHDRAGLERLCRYGGRPAFAGDRIGVTTDGQVSYRLKKPWSDGRTHLELSPVAFLRRLAGILPPPRRHLVRYAGVFASRARRRSRVVALAPANVADGVVIAARPSTPSTALAAPVPPPTARRGEARLPWADLLRRVFAHDVLSCPCGGRRRVIAFITDTDVARDILTALGLSAAIPSFAPARAPPTLDDWLGHSDPDMGDLINAPRVDLGSHLPAWSDDDLSDPIADPAPAPDDFSDPPAWDEADSP